MQRDLTKDTDRRFKSYLRMMVEPAFFSQEGDLRAARVDPSVVQAFEDVAEKGRILTADVSRGQVNNLESRLEELTDEVNRIRMDYGDLRQRAAVGVTRRRILTGLDMLSRERLEDVVLPHLREPR